MHKDSLRSNIWSLLCKDIKKPTKLMSIITTLIDVTPRDGNGSGQGWGVLNLTPNPTRFEKTHLKLDPAGESSIRGETQPRDEGKHMRALAINVRGEDGRPTIGASASNTRGKG